MADTVVVKRTENRLIVTKQDPKAVIAAPYVKNINQYAYSLTVLGYYENLSALVAGVSTPDVGDVYGVGTSAPYTIYIWDGTSWVDNGTIKGDKGDPTEWLRGTVDPNTEGVDGDLYLNYTTWHVWEKISGTWTDRGSIKGVDGSGSGDVTGPSSSVDSNFAAFDGVTGKLIKDSGVKPSDFSVPEATETVKGVVELATPAEVLAGEDAERAVTPAGFKAALVSPAMTGSATLNGTTNNTVQLTGIVTTLALEVGDVIRIQYSGYDKLHTVESITNNDLIIVNYEHAGNRANGSLKLADKTTTVTITRIAKWFNAPIGLGQAWVDVTATRVRSTTYTNDTSRAITVIINSATNRGVQAEVDGFSVYANYTPDSTPTRGSATFIVPPSSTYLLGLPITGWIWGELR